MKTYSPLLLVLGPGIVAYFVVIITLWKSTIWRWWEFLLPWIAPLTWFELSLHFHHPAKSLGNIFEIVGLGFVPAAYLGFRTSILKRIPTNLMSVAIGLAAVALAIAIFFLTPKMPE